MSSPAAPSHPVSMEQIQALQQRCERLEARTASLAALVAALLKDHVHRDQLQTRWAEYLGPALHDLGPGLEPGAIEQGSEVPGWVQLQLDR